MDGYKKCVMVGCVVLLAGYPLPWFKTLLAHISGIDLIMSGIDAVRTMRALGHWDVSMLLGYSALTLPLLGALFSLVYCLARPAGENGRFGTILFLTPLFALLALWIYFTAASFELAPGSGVAGPLASLIVDDGLDLSRTGGLWAVHCGALLMLLGRLSR